MTLPPALTGSPVSWPMLDSATWCIVALSPLACPRCHTVKVFFAVRVDGDYRCLFCSTPTHAGAA